jgi:hypothetical protein
MPIDAARLIITVTAGLIPGDPMPAFTRYWGITSGEWEAAGKTPFDVGEARATLLGERAEQAFDYARELQNPNRVNWVRVDWVWV